MKRGTIAKIVIVGLFLSIVLNMAGASVNMLMVGSCRGGAGIMSVMATGPKDSKLKFEPNTGVGYRDNTVYKKGAGLEINFAAGYGDDEGQGSYGFQPNSTYRFENLFKVVNKSTDTVKLWITVHGFFSDFDWVKVYSDNNWNKDLDPWSNPIYLKGNESFFMSVVFEDIPFDMALGQYLGSIRFHTEEPRPEEIIPIPEEPSAGGPTPITEKPPAEEISIIDEELPTGYLPGTGGPGPAVILPVGIGAGLVAMGIGMRHRRKRK